MKKNKDFEIGQVVYVYFNNVLSLEEAVIQDFKSQYIKVKYAFGTKYVNKDNVFATRQECIDYAVMKSLFNTMI